MVRLSTGEVETLLTSLNEKQLPIGKAADLYFKRWAVETSYDLIKSKLQLENFSGKTVVSVYQDFYATMYISNLSAFVAGSAYHIIAKADESKALKYQRAANRNRTIYKLRALFLRLIMKQDAARRDQMIARLLCNVVKYPVSIVPGRSPIRKPSRKKRFYMARKSVV